MEWKPYELITDVLQELPTRDFRDINAGHSIPNVYGKAIQFYIELLESNQEHDYTTDAVRLWRGLVSMLALHKTMNLGLSWEKVTLLPSGENLLSRALENPPGEEERLLFSAREMKWDGRSFFVLKKERESGRTLDLLLYSPNTLLLPVADWRKVYAAFPEIKWFDRQSAHFLQPEKVLNEAELKIVWYWLEQVANAIRGYASRESHSPPTEARTILMSMIDYYQRDLKQALGLPPQEDMLRPQEVNSYAFVPFGANTDLEGLPPFLSRTVRSSWTLDSRGAEKREDSRMTSVSMEDMFADQLCFFQCERNPFFACRHSESYLIENTGFREGINWYAFLPVGPRLRKYYEETDLSSGVSMRRITRNGKTYIHVRLDVPNDMKSGSAVERDYEVAEHPEDFDRRYAAIPYQFSENGSKIVPTDVPTSDLPLVALWPPKIENRWRAYYVMLISAASKGASLRVSDGVDGEETAETGDNPYVAKINYFPVVIPFKMTRKFHYFKEKEFSIGFLTPEFSTSAWNGGIKTGGKTATVAVDFGTSSVRVFAKVSDQMLEVPIVTGVSPSYATYVGALSGGERNAWIEDNGRFMRENFVAPAELKDVSSSMFTIYRRSSLRNKPEVKPILDGVIYQFGDTVTGRPDGNCLLNLKWNVEDQKDYYLAFLKQLCLQVAAWLYDNHSVTAFHWKYTFPESLSFTEQKIVRNNWDTLCRYLNEDSNKIYGVNFTHDITPDNRDDKPIMFESQAASQYFLYLSKGVAQASMGYLVVDIGGGSMDIALWQRDKKMYLIQETSVARAGRVMFTDMIHKNIDNFRNMFPPDLDVTAANVDMSRVLTDRLLSTSSASMLSRYNNDMSSGWATELRKTFTLEAALLLYALGYYVGDLLSCGVYAIPQGVRGAFEIDFGGRGSELFRWVPLPDGDFFGLQEMFKAGVRATGSEFAPPVSIHLSGEPKAEVAKGLLVEGTVPWERRGDAFLSDQNPARLLPDKPPAPTDEQFVEAIRDFLKCFNAIFVEGRGEAETLRMEEDINDARISSNLDGYFSVNPSSDIMNVFMNPLFDYLIP